MSRPMLVRIAFLGYAALLLVLTHWPRLVVDGPVARTDLYIHVGAFGLWNALFIGSQLLGPWHRAGVIARCTLVAAAFAAVDEASQMIPAVGRTCDPLDVTANVGGTILAGLAVLGLSSSRTARKLAGAWLETPVRSEP